LTLKIRTDRSILTVDTAEELDIDRGARGGALMSCESVNGDETWGFGRWILLQWGPDLHPVPVLVPPLPEALENAYGPPLVPIEPSCNILGRGQLTTRFLLCFDNSSLYAFPKRLGAGRKKVKRRKRRS